MTTHPHAFVPPTDAQVERFVGVAARFAEELRALGYSSDSISRLLGAEGLRALDRGEPGIVSYILDSLADVANAPTSTDTRLIAAVQLFILGAEVDASALFSSELLEALTDSGVLLQATPGLHVACIDVRPIVVSGVDRLVFSDRDASMSDHVPGPDHVLGVGRASRSLLDISPTSPVGTVLDLGAGCGIQSLGQYESGAVVATDLHPRANSYARATFAAAGLDNVEVREGSWFEPVAGRQFDRIVANPPFVVGLPSVEHVYRDSGLNLDGATELMLRSLADHLTSDGTAHLLGAWVHRDGESWQSRIASWLPADGLEVWVTQRDVASPTDYIDTWLRDESIDPRSADGRARARQWLHHFRESGVTGIGFGYITVARIDGPTSAVCEEMPQPLAGPFSQEAEEYLGRAAWLREQTTDSVLGATFRVRPGVAIERVSLADEELAQGFTHFDTRISRTDGPAWSHSIDELVASIIGALHPEAALGSVIDVMDMLGAFGQADVSEIKDAVVPLIVDLVRHGIVLPTEVLD
nr:methyltransferase [Corynebacterium lactis]